MKVIPTEIEGVVIIEPDVFGDERGYFMESWSQQRFDEAVRPTCSICGGQMTFDANDSGARIVTLNAVAVVEEETEE